MSRAIKIKSEKVHNLKLPQVIINNSFLDYTQFFLNIKLSPQFFVKINL